jgi:hypothetical protein
MSTSETSPLCIESLKISSSGALNIGTTVTCVETRVDTAPPTNSLVSWPEGDFTFHLLPQHDCVAEINEQFQETPDHELIYQAGSGSAVMEPRNLRHLQSPRLE